MVAFASSAHAGISGEGLSARRVAPWALLNYKGAETPGKCYLAGSISRHPPQEPGKACSHLLACLRGPASTAALGPWAFEGRVGLLAHTVAAPVPDTFPESPAFLQCVSVGDKLVFLGVTRHRWATKGRVLC